MANLPSNSKFARKVARKIEKVVAAERPQAAASRFRLGLTLQPAASGRGLALQAREQLLRAPEQRGEVRVPARRRDRRGGATVRELRPRVRSALPKEQLTRLCFF